jgi:alpha-beta hydrolase superfamily lysophospholipase
VRNSHHYTLIMVSLAFAPASSVQAQAGQQSEVTRWQIYGAPITYEYAVDVPGDGAVTVAPRGVGGEPWSSGAKMVIQNAIQTGDHVTASFWARADQSTRIAISIQGEKPDYVALGSKQIDIGKKWQRFSVGGIAKSDQPARSQSLTLQLGRILSNVSLGPAAFTVASKGRTAVTPNFKGFKPSRVAQDVKITSEPGVTLAATLHMPIRKSVAPPPLVVLLSGSGPAPRGLYPLLIERLAAQGIATLDYDKRGVGQSTGILVDTVELMQHDAASVVAYLKTRSDIDARRIAMVGVSQGGVVVPSVAANDPAIAAVVTLAGPTGEQGKFFIDAMRLQLISGGTRKEAIESILSATVPFMDANVAGASPDKIKPLEQVLREQFILGGWSAEKTAEFLTTLRGPIVVSAYKAAPNHALSQIKAPVLALYAEKDDVVSTAYSMPQAQFALRENKNAIIREMHGVDHNFNRVGIPHLDEVGRIVPLMSDSDTLDVVTNWLTARLTK